MLYIRHSENDQLVKVLFYQDSHMQKAMIQMNLHLHNAVSDITGVTGMAIIRAILNGERNPDTLAKMRDPRCANPVEIIKKFNVRETKRSHRYHEIDFTKK